MASKVKADALDSFFRFGDKVTGIGVGGFFLEGCILPGRESLLAKSPLKDEIEPERENEEEAECQDPLLEMEAWDTFDSFLVSMDSTG